MTELQEALGRCRIGLYGVFAFSAAINILMLTVAIYMLQVYDRVLLSRSTETLIYLTILAFAALLLLGFFDLLRSRVLVRLGGWLDRVLAPSAFRRGIDNSLLGSEYRTQALRDLGAIRALLGGPAVSALCDAPWVPAYIALIYLLHPVLGHLALVGGCFLLLLAVANHWLTRSPLEKANAAQVRALREAEAAFRNAEVVDSMAMRQALVSRWDAQHAHMLEAHEAASDISGGLTAMTKAFRLMLQVGLLGCGAWLVLGEQLSPGGMIAASIILGRALAPVEQVIGAWKQLTSARDALQRVAEHLRQSPLRSQIMALPRPQGQLTVEDVTYAPPGAQLPVIKGVNMEVEPGEVVAVIGPSAAGKSTLARLLVGIGRPQVGRVRLDGADISSLARESERWDVGYLPQNVELFPGTIRENIARMEDGDPVKIVSAARMAGVHEMILRLPAGYDTQISEQGGLLSGGQRQRIGLARALYDKPALLVLDEPNAHLDGAGEEALNRAIREAKALGCTVVLVAHRPSLMVHVDKVAVLNAGQLEMFGEQGAVLGRLQQRARSDAGERRIRVVGRGA